MESKLLLQRLSLDSLADVEALPQAWERILERYKEDSVVEGSSVCKELWGFPQGFADVPWGQAHPCWLCCSQQQWVSPPSQPLCSEILVSIS